MVLLLDSTILHTSFDGFPISLRVHTSLLGLRRVTVHLCKVTVTAYNTSEFQIKKAF